MVREGYDQPITLAVTRDEIPKHSVDVAFVVRPGIGYVRLSAFNEETDTELAAALKQIEWGNLDGLVLDLRGNPGGLLNEAVAVSDMFLDKNQLIVSHHGRASRGAALLRRARQSRRASSRSSCWSTADRRRPRKS